MLGVKRVPNLALSPLIRDFVALLQSNVLLHVLPSYPAHRYHIQGARQMYSICSGSCGTPLLEHSRQGAASCLYRPLADYAKVSWLNAHASRSLPDIMHMMYAEPIRLPH